MGWIGLFGVGLGLFLLVITLIGRFNGPVKDAVVKDRRPIWGYDYRSISPRIARSRFARLKHSALTDSEKVEQLFQLISGSIIHRKYRLNVFDNWLLWLAGFFYPPLRNTQDADLLWQRGAGKCDQASLLFTAKAKELGFDSRILGLDGHILAQAKAGNSTYIVDADMGQFWEHDYSKLKSLDESQLLHQYENRGFAEPQAHHTVEIIRNSHTQIYCDYPPAKTRYRFERLAKLLQWIFPIIFILTSYQLTN